MSRAKVSWAVFVVSGTARLYAGKTWGDAWLFSPEPRRICFRALRREAQSRVDELAALGFDAKFERREEA